VGPRTGLEAAERRDISVRACNDPRFLGYTADSRVAVLTELSLLLLLEIIAVYSDNDMKPENTLRRGFEC
jgi:hypothetical protein